VLTLNQVSYPFLDAGKEINTAEPVQLSITAGATDYHLEVSASGETASAAVKSESLTIFPPVGGAFCGTMFGIYSFGKSEPVLDAADFTDIEIKATN
jgi:hypothetical protein